MGGDCFGCCSICNPAPLLRLYLQEVLQTIEKECWLIEIAIVAVVNTLSEMISHAIVKTSIKFMRLPYVEL